MIAQRRSLLGSLGKGLESIDGMFVAM